MRVLRLPAVILTILGLLAVLAVPVAAQEAAPVTSVSGIVVEAFVHVEAPGYGMEEQTASDEVRGYEEVIGGTDLIEQTVEWSDPRLPAKQWFSLRYHALWSPIDDLEGATTTTTTHLLIDDAGSWHGEGRFVSHGDEHFSLYTLTGQGAYEGIYAVLRGAPGEDTQGPHDLAYEGYIIEGDAGPP